MRAIFYLLLFINAVVKGQTTTLHYFTEDQKVCGIKEAFYQKEKTIVNDSCTIVRLYKMKEGLIKEISYLDSSEKIKNGIITEFQSFLNDGYSIIKNLGIYKKNKKDGAWITFDKQLKISKYLIFFENKFVKDINNSNVLDSNNNNEVLNYILNNEENTISSETLKKNKITFYKGISNYVKNNLIKETTINKLFKNSPNIYNFAFFTFNSDFTVKFLTLCNRRGSELDVKYRKVLENLPNFTSKYHQNINFKTVNLILPFLY